MNREKLIASLKQIETLAQECIKAADESRPTDPKKPKQPPTAAPPQAAPSFALPLRPFVKKYAKKMSGPEKFTLILAHMSKGKTGVPVQLAAIATAWNKMTGHLGDFNAAYATRAKDNGWADSPKQGSYTLLADWMEILHAAAR